ncbi:DNA polymerase III alpha subunit [Arcticibacter tournemirensis]|uniref:DNA polymerase III subunit alpha n=1 Tax=Arcticibacter tournemirensis TaxID=699437 RepID=A0A4Q0M8J2_9SPHI|nr:DNA polymerase III subunit alpha [Arcticibacter tournemirensis]KAA8486753.1 DNA polymerase III subunit alpha [Arcticibacter tournemirensis]RXF69471.1 DNA polymerase III subunit alpha [Arcticibacter tournemirensis]TQM49295.1 DNA polymerase III alpha subunit [Arcticibacter tournemirensis]
MPEFSHLHVHTQFSLLDGAADISKLYKKAAADGMKALAITDHGNMFGVFKFVAEAGKHNVKPIVGCEFYVVDDRHKKQFTKENRDVRYHQLFLAKNAQGYKNLVKLCSLGYMEGLYSKWPRIDKELILKYHEGLIATSCCIGASVPQAILKKGEEEAEKEFKWWLDLFGDDYYIELQRHNIPEQLTINETLLKFAKKHNVKVICSNDSHYVDQQDANAHDILLCVNTGDMQSTPIATDEEGGKGYRFGFPNDQFYFKTQAEMAQLFHDVPQSLDNTNEIVDKVEHLKLKRDILLPNFPIPSEFKIHADDVLNQWEYLRHLTMTGARQRYQDITPEVQERLDFELNTIKIMGFAGYFLIVSDFIKAGRDLGVFIGPGRGSAAGSVVAYCIGITNIDPIKYNLLFERFLNPDRKSMPDIDTDFDDEGRQKVIDYVVDKYGKNQVAQIVTYGSMAARTSIQDVARVLDVPLPDVNALKKLVPDTLGITLKEAFNQVDELKEILKGDDIRAKVLREAEKLEGSIRNTGVHAAGVIIAPEDITNIIPVATAKDSSLLITQFDGRVIEDAGVIKMDFLGLKTLTIIKDALRLIKQNYGVEIEIDNISLTDEKTFELYQHGDTNGTFQFESDGMQMYLRELKPDKFEDLIAMNALYRPGPIEYIPNFIARKHGREQVSYDLPDMEEYLADTYGITVYQEQVMLLSQKLANFTKGDADVLRKAMGKKDRKTLDKLKPQFIENAKKKGHDEKKLEKIWTDWEAFASYAFNKSHSTCYAFVAYQTAYLKAHYPAEYMAAVLNNQNNIEKISFFMEESRKMGIPVLGPDINESGLSFGVNKKGEIRFGMSGVKGVGEKAVESIIEEREANGPYENINDFARRVNSRTVNKKVYENLVYSGAFDCFGYHRAQFFFKPDNSPYNGIERLIKYNNDYQNSLNSSQASLFGGTSDANIPEPQMPECPDWGLLDKLKYEKDMIGIYLTGHPLDNYKFELDHFCSHQIKHLSLINKAKSGEMVAADAEEFNKIKNREIVIGGLVSNAQHRTTKTGKPFGSMMLEDYSDSFEIVMFGEEYVKQKLFFADGYFLQVKGMICERFRQKDNWEFKVIQITLLSDLRDKMARCLTIQLPLHELSESFITEMDGIVKANEEQNINRNCQLKFAVYDLEETISIEMPSKSLKIFPSNEFLEQLHLKNLTFKLN